MNASVQGLGDQGLGDVVKRVIEIARSRTGRFGLVIGVAVAALLGFAAPAYAHHPVLSGFTTCSDGVHVVHWSIGNSEANATMNIQTATATIGAQSYAVTGYSTPVGDSGTTSATTLVPGGTTGTITLTVNAVWSDNFTDTQSTSVDLISNCSTTTTAAPSTTQAPTTTAAPTTLPPTTQAPTTTGAPTTTQAPTTTAAPTTTVASTSTLETTTSIGEQGSTTSSPSTTSAPTTTVAPTTTAAPSTTVAATTSIGPTTTVHGQGGSTTLLTTSTTQPQGATSTSDTPVGPQGGPVTTLPGSPTLPRTGSSSGVPAAVGIGIVLAGGLLAARRRRSWTRS